MESVCLFIGPFSGHILPAGQSCLMDSIGILLTLLISCILLSSAVYISNNRTYILSTVRPRYTLHYWRCCLQIFLILIHIMESGAYFVTLERRHLPLVSILIPITQLSSLLIGLYFHHVIEKRRLIKYNILVIVYFTLMSAWRVYNITVLMSNVDLYDVNWRNITHTLYIMICVLLVVITLTDCVVLHIELKSNIKSESNDTAKATSYKHNMVNAFSQMTFWWLNPLLLSGYQDPIELQDLGNLPRKECADVQFRKFMEIYKGELISMKVNNTKLSLWKCINSFIWQNFYLGGIFKLLGDMVGLIGPLGISVILNYIVKINDTSVITITPETLYPSVRECIGNGYVMGFIVLIAAVAQGTFSQCSTHLVNIEGIRLKSALQSLIYHKCLRISSWSTPDANTLEKKSVNIDNKVSNDGRKSISQEEAVDTSSITNLMSEDSFNIMSFIWIGHYVWAIPLKISVIMCLLYINLGISAIIGAMICIFTMTPLQFYIGKKMSSNSKGTAERSDVRLMKINEVFQGIKVLKMYGWEKIYGDKIHEARCKELELLNWDSFYWAIMTFLTHASSVLITLVTFGLYFVLENNLMTAANVFAGLALFNQLTVPLFIFPVTLPIIISATVSVRRLEDFLNLPEVNNPKCNKAIRKDLSSPIDQVQEDIVKTDKFPPYSLENILEAEENETEDVFRDNSSDKNSSAGSSLEENREVNKTNKIIRINNAIFVWGENDSATRISIANVDIPLGKLTIVIGRTGSGKSSFLSAIIQEMNLVHGDIQYASEFPIAYVTQSPWLTNSTIRDNILFGRTMRARRYRRVLAACSLHADLAMHNTRDLTSVNALSGGQRQRVALARALYSRAKVLILDDPLSALDHTVAQKVFDRGIKKACERSNRTVIMITHRQKLLSRADQIIHVDNGRVTPLGTLNDVEKSNPELLQEWHKIFNNSKENMTSTDEREKDKITKINWQLLKIANKVTRNYSTNSGEDNVECNPDEVDVATFVPLKKRLSGFQGSRYFTHDLVLPTDECDDEVLRTSVPKRSSTRRRRAHNSGRLEQKKHKTAERSSSLQVGKHKIKPAPMVRQLSSPAIRCSHNNSDVDYLNRSKQHDSKNHQKYLLRNILSTSPQKLIDSQNDEPPINRQRSIIKRLLSRSSTKRKSTSLTSNDNEHTPVKRILSTTSAMSDEYADDDVFYKENTSASIIPDEEREYGKISKKVYLEYMKASGYFVGGYYILSSLGWQILRTYTDMWLSEWTRRDSEIQNFDIDTYDMSKYFTIYSILSVASILTSFTSNVIGQYAGARARDNLHTKLLNNIVMCPVGFFEKTPFGRIMNRFSTDIGIIDKKIATSIQRLIQFLFLCISAILINAVITPWFLIISIPISVLYYVIQKYYRRSARELQRLDAITKSPVFSHFGETLSGLSSIRAYGHQERFTNTLWTKMDINTNAFIILNSNNRWLGIALDYLGGVIVFVAIITALITAKLYPESVSPSLAGLAINYTLLVPIYLNWVVKFLSDLEMYMSAVERVQQYSSLPTEETGGITVPHNWPKWGQVIFSGVTLQYDESNEAVVSKLDLQIPAGQKIAICGRTGSGKSTLAMSLLRMVNISEGTITIDGTDIKSVALHYLRSHLAIVPQEGMLYGGSLRDNLIPQSNTSNSEKSNKKNDKNEKPFDLWEYCCKSSMDLETSDNFRRLSIKHENSLEGGMKRTDSEIWEILEMVQLKDSVAASPAGLDTNINEGGIGWSVGEKQQLCLARALLKSGSVLILDEPTSALDPATEATIMPALNKSGKTIITIAHRLSTIMEYDRVLVMEEGRIVEDGSPTELLSRPMSIFSSMLRASED